MDLEFETNYEISVIAIDTIGKIKQLNVNQTTLDKLYLYDNGAEYTTITGGWKHTGYHITMVHLQKTKIACIYTRQMDQEYIVEQQTK